MPISLPHGYTPRAYQLPFWRYMAARQARQRAALVWHRRAGKDVTAWNWTIFAAATQRKGTYYFFTPTYAQGKKIIWDGMTGDGRRFLSYIPEELLAGKNEVEMQLQVRHVSGETSIVQIVGTDRLDSIRGTNPVGCVFDEFSFGNPRAWDIVEPILLENGGWAVFVFTPNGKNHAFDLWEAARQDPDWYSSLLTIKDTQREDGTPVIDEAYMETLRKRGIDEEVIQSEYYCSFTGGVLGSYYARLIDVAWKEGRIRDVAWEPQLPVETWWDLGLNDSMSIGFVQRLGREIRCIDYLENSGEGLPFYAKELRGERPYVYGAHILPHDANVRELGTGKSRVETLTVLGLRPVIVAPKLALADGINAVRTILPRMWFDKTKCKRWVDALTQYHKKYDEERKVFSNEPQHDWSSHPADMTRTGAVGARELRVSMPPTQADIDFDPLSYGPRSRAEADTEFSIFS